MLAPVFGVRSATWPGAVAVAAGLPAMAGLGIVATASVALGERNLSPFPKPKEEAALVEHGIFSIVRHPIYGGVSLSSMRSAWPSRE
ncbi:hypothetical protein [Actinomadura alba]|uniref:Isoprenylcysteine carboxylmethyltransferase family protein n=1 Tax=Actinomadura alba TaxID=406431 RepID=A0ABR7LKA3_9ACTN|nr:hypothetical protein [Actinomadura alba]MBC6465277.1 hypothetical protein [Actinomadura alba]